MEGVKLGHESIKKEFMSKLRKQYIEELFSRNRRKLMGDSAASPQKTPALPDDREEAEEKSLEILRNRFLLAYQELNEEDIRKWLKRICRVAFADPGAATHFDSFPNEREKTIIQDLFQPQRLAKQATIRTLTKYRCT